MWHYGDEFAVNSGFNREMRKDFCLNFIQPFLEHIDRKSRNDGSRELMPLFYGPHLKRLILFSRGKKTSSRPVIVKLTRSHSLQPLFLGKVAVL